MTSATAQSFNGPLHGGVLHSDTDDRLLQSESVARRAHAGQVRKGANTPYIEHPLGVAALVKQYGGVEDQQIAAVLHDVLEDGGAQYIGEVSEFGQDVLRMVRDCSDCIPAAGEEKGPWKARKEAYIAHLRNVLPDSLLVSACDKLYNLRSIIADHEAIGDAVFDRFSAPKEETLWYYCALGVVFADRRPAPAADYQTDLATLLARV